MSILKDKQVLIVDDEADLREMLESELSDCGARILQAENGKKAIELFHENNLDLIVSDIRMPGGSGLDLLTAVRNHHHTYPPFVFITAYSDVSSEELFARGAQGVFYKPFDLLNLISNLEKRLLPNNERLSKPIQLDIVECVEFEEGKKSYFMMGHGGVLVHTGRSLLTPDTFTKFKFKLKDNGQDIILSGVGYILWSGFVNANHDAVSGIEFCYLDESCRELALKKIQEVKSVSFIPERIDKFE